MTRLRILVGLMFAPLTFTMALAQEDVPEWPERAIDFEMLDEPMEIEDFEALPGQTWPRFVANIEIDDASGFGMVVRTGALTLKRHQSLTQKLLGTIAARRFSDAQRDYLRASTWVRRRDAKVVRYQYALYAMSEEDARLMVQAVLEMLDAQRRAGFEKKRAWLIEHLDEIARAERQLPALQNEREELAQRYQNAQKATRYKDRAAAEEDVEPLSRSLRSIEVSVAGINAKIEAIRALKAKKADKVNESTLAVLDRLLIEQDIELAGALARKTVLEQHLGRAKAYIEARTKYDHVLKQLDSLRSDIRRGKSSAKSIERDLLEPDRRIRPVKLHGKAVIQRVKYQESE